MNFRDSKLFILCILLQEGIAGQQDCFSLIRRPHLPLSGILHNPQGSLGEVGPYLASVRIVRLVAEQHGVQSIAAGSEASPAN